MLQQKLELQKRVLNEVGFTIITYNTADGKSHTLHDFVDLVIGVNGIWRTVQVFVRKSEDLRKDTDLSLLLGLSWLFQV